MAAADAIIWAFAYGGTPYFVVTAFGQLMNVDFLLVPAVFLGILLFVSALYYGYQNNTVDRLLIADDQIEHTYAKWGKNIIDSVKLSEIESVYAAPRTKSGGATLWIQSKNPMSSLVAKNYPLHKLKPIIDHLEQYVANDGARLDIVNDTHVDIKNLKKVIVIVSGVIIIPFVLYVIYLFISTT